MKRTFVAGMLAIGGLLSAAPGLAQSGRFYARTTPVGPDATAGMITDRVAQAPLKANMARVLAPDFEVAGDVTIVDGAPAGGLIGMFKQQVVLSVPVRFRMTATLDQDFKYGVLSLAHGTVMHRRFLSEAAGAMTGSEDWCGLGARQGREVTTPRLLCFGRQPDGKIRLYSAMDGIGKGEPFYRSAERATYRDPNSLTDYNGPVPAMTPVAQAPADMTAELAVLPSVTDGDFFVWHVKKGDALAVLGYSNDSPGNRADYQDDWAIERVGWADLVFVRSGSRLNYQGYVDRTVRHPEEAAMAANADAHPAGMPAQLSSWKMGPMDVAPDSLLLDTASAAEGKIGLTLKAHLRHKVRLLEGSHDDGAVMRFVKGGIQVLYMAGDVFYASEFTRYYPSGAPYTQPAWCGHVQDKGFYTETRMVCFSPEDPDTATRIDYKGKWLLGEDVGAQEIGYQYRVTLPRYETVAPGPEDDCDIAITLRRDDKKHEGIAVGIVYRKAGADEYQTDWRSEFDDKGVARINVFGKALVVTRDGPAGLKAELTDGGVWGGGIYSLQD